MKKKILICDDDEGILEMLEFVLDDNLYTTFTELDSLRVIDGIKRFQPELVVLDLWMPVLSGDQITMKIRSMPQYGSLPILIISASRDGESIAKAAGATAYLAKPFDIADFEDEIKRLTSSMVCPN